MAAFGALFLVCSRLCCCLVKMLYWLLLGDGLAIPAAELSVLAVAGVSAEVCAGSAAVVAIGLGTAALPVELVDET